MSYRIITGANDNYILTLINFINYHLKIGIEMKNLIVYDLGLSEFNLNKLKNITNENIIIKKFEYDNYPEHVNLNKYKGLFCSYAFKPIIIYNEAVIFKDELIIWLDCACNITIEILNKIIDSINTYGFYCPVGNYEKTIESIELNHPQTLNLLGVSEYQHLNELQTRLACICGVNYSNFNGKIILDDWYKFSLNKNIIMPEGSSRNNHRQDQTILSVLMMFHEKKYNIVFEKSTFNIKCWVKHDENIIENNFNNYVLFQINNNIRLACVFANTIEEAITIYQERKLMALDEFLKYFYVLKE
jgi:hypothetical protein